MTRQMVFRYVGNIRLIGFHSDLGPFSPPQRPSLIPNIAFVVSRPCQCSVEIPFPHQ
jgi:hypothetical protein